MKLSKVAAAVAALLATDAKPTEAQIMAACIAADKKGKDEGGLGPVEIEKKDKAKDEKDDPEHTNDEKDDDEKAKDEMEKAAKDKKGKDDEMDVEGMDDEQPTKSATGNLGAGGKEPAKDKKGMDSAAVAALIAANDAKHAAARDVEPILGVVTHDSADAYYKAALTKLGVDTAGVHASAFPTMLKLARDKLSAQTPSMASDAARVTGMAGAIKGYDRLR
jgi:uncharacterized protein